MKNMFIFAALALCAGMAAADDAVVTPATQTNAAAQPAAAATTPAAAPAATPAAAPVAAPSPAVQPESAPVEITTTTVMAKLAEWDKKLETLKLSFTQDISFGNTGVTSKISGNVTYQKPDKLRIEHVSPQKQLVYTDKHVIWIYKPQDAQVVKARWEDWLRQQSGAFAGITDFGSYSKLLETHNLEVTKQKKAGTVTAVFTPKKDPKAYELKLVLSAKDFFPVAILLKLDTTTVNTRLENIERNGKLPDGALDFVPPQGVTVLELDGNK
jgi:outer membrane lipoprotein-sorting protein